MNEKLLASAVKKGIINEEQAENLLNFIEEESVSQQTSALKTAKEQSDNKGSADDPSPDSSNQAGEQLKFVRSFGDVFIALGVLLIAFTSNQLIIGTFHQVIAIVAFFVISEWLVGHKRLVLPGITLLLSILYFVNNLVDGLSDLHESIDVISMVAVGMLFYFRYKMPFSLYPVAVGSIYLAIELLGINVIEQPYIFILLGIAVFVVAMWYDSRDTKRISSLSDNAFWLHLLAAPLIVHGVMVSLFLSKQNHLPANSVSILILFVLFFFIALFVDRRAILVSSFAYALYAVFKFANEQFMQVDNLTLFIFMGTGLFIIFFGTYWYKIRTLVFSRIASLKVSQLVPPFT